MVVIEKSALPKSYPDHQMNWAVEVGVSHSMRMAVILRDLGLVVKAVLPFQASSVEAYPDLYSVLLYIHKNPVLLNLPYECYKYISRVFYVPFACRDPLTIADHSALKGNLCVKITGYPKAMESDMIDMICGALEESRITPHPTKYDYIIMCIYSACEGLYRWGIVNSFFCETQLLTTSHLQIALQVRRLKEVSEPTVSRAYYKLQEVLAYQLPRLGWRWIKQHEKRQNIAIDVGASPGGFTQILSSCCEHVIAIDPGELHPIVLARPNVTHVRSLVQEEATQRVLRLCNDISLIVCDMNDDADAAAELLACNVLEHVAGFGRCCGGAECIAEGDCVVLMLTLKLFRRPKRHHVYKAVRDAVQRLERLQPDNRCIRCVEGDWHWRWKWRCDDVASGDNPATNTNIIPSYDMMDAAAESRVNNGRKMNCEGDDLQLIHLCSNSGNERTLLFRRMRKKGRS